uniref:Uncharacterized protein n=1 Tax=Arundo donax TaxID=35708 RepID=A0A0A8YMY9_ARUDO
MFYVPRTFPALKATISCNLPRRANSLSKIIQSSHTDRLVGFR